MVPMTSCSAWQVDAALPHQLPLIRAVVASSKGAGQPAWSEQGKQGSHAAQQNTYIRLSRPAVILAC